MSGRILPAPVWVEQGHPALFRGKETPRYSDEVPVGAGRCALVRGAIHRPENVFPLDSLGHWLGVPISPFGHFAPTHFAPTSSNSNSQAGPVGARGRRESVRGIQGNQSRNGNGYAINCEITPECEKLNTPCQDSFS